MTPIPQIMTEGLEVVIKYKDAKYQQVASPTLTHNAEIAILKKDLAHLRVHSPSQKNVRRVDGSFVLHWPSAGTSLKVDEVSVPVRDNTGIFRWTRPNTTPSPSCVPISRRTRCILAGSSYARMTPNHSNSESSSPCKLPACQTPSVALTRKVVGLMQRIHHIDPRVCTFIPLSQCFLVDIEWILSSGAVIAATSKLEEAHEDVPESSLAARLSDPLPEAESVVAVSVVPSSPPMKPSSSLQKPPPTAVGPIEISALISSSHNLIAAQVGKGTSIPSPVSKETFG
jgi:hypothetical protein